MDGLGFLLDAPYVASPHHELDAPILSLDAYHMVLDGLVLGLGFHGEVSLALFHHCGSSPWMDRPTFKEVEQTSFWKVLMVVA